jgi:hypothetical protein
MCADTRAHQGVQRRRETAQPDVGEDARDGCCTDCCRCDLGLCVAVGMTTCAPARTANLTVMPFIAADGTVTSMLIILRGTTINEHELRAFADAARTETDGKFAFTATEVCSRNFIFINDVCARSVRSRPICRSWSTCEQCFCRTCAIVMACAVSASRPMWRDLARRQETGHCSPRRSRIAPAGGTGRVVSIVGCRSDHPTVTQ